MRGGCERGVRGMEEGCERGVREGGERGVCFIERGV